MTFFAVHFMHLYSYFRTNEFCFSCFQSDAPPSLIFLPSPKFLTLGDVTVCKRPYDLMHFYGDKQGVNKRRLGTTDTRGHFKKEMGFTTTAANNYAV